MSEKIIGIIGGMGPEATVDLYGAIIRATPARKDQDHLRVIIDSNPKIPDRTPAIIGDGEDPVPAMAHACRVLKEAGADFGIIPCISAHHFLEALRQQIDLPILSVFGAVSAYIANHHPEVKTVGLLATSGTLQSGRFARRLGDQGISVIAPDAEHQALVMKATYQIKASHDPALRAQSRAYLISAARHVIRHGAQGIIAGCTEVSLELKPQDLPRPIFNPSEILALAAVQRAISGK